MIFSSSPSREGHLLRMCSFTDKEWIFFQALPHPKGQGFFSFFFLSLSSFQRFILSFISAVRASSWRSPSVQTISSSKIYRCPEVWMISRQWYDSQPFCYIRSSIFFVFSLPLHFQTLLLKYCLSFLSDVIFYFW